MLGAFALGGEPCSAIEPVHGAVDGLVGAVETGRHQVWIVEVRQGGVGKVL